MRDHKLRTLVGISMFGVLSYLVMLLEIPILPGFPFLKLDFSDLIVLCGLYLFGVSGAVGTALIRAFLHLVMTGFAAPSLIGELGSVTASLTLIFVLAFFMKRQSKWWQRLGMIICSTLALTFVMAVMNYFILTPLYVEVSGFKIGMDYLKYVLIAIVPFNLIKGALVTALFTLIYTKIGPWLLRQGNQRQ
ncbi:ECF transporter S component [Lapidilactobacillus bayanensis]|uniref:ECF transporter S component n=1 Tax=Lapidilactobacillus bayanensis TaxID=2485998 RepID=UPI000F779288|nr:ECF transporter S component [Lapidilactobacillus bayanensis]